MRQNTVDCFAALLKGKSYQTKSGAIHTDGKKIFSYGTCIAVPVPGSEGHEWLLTMQKYSKTTTRQENALHALLCAAKRVVKLVSQAEVNKAAADPENWI